MGRHPIYRAAAITAATCVTATLFVAAPASAGKHDIAPPSTTWGDASADKEARDDWTGDNDARKDPGSLYTIGP